MDSILFFVLEMVNGTQKRCLNSVVRPVNYKKLEIIILINGRSLLELILFGHSRQANEPLRIVE